MGRLHIAAPVLINCQPLWCVGYAFFVDSLLQSFASSMKFYSILNLNMYRNVF